MQSFSTKTKCTNKCTRPKLMESSLFQIFNHTHTHNTVINQLLGSWQIKENHWSAMKRCILFWIQSFSSKTKCTNKFTTLKLMENSLLKIFNNIHIHIRSDQPTFRVMENTAKLLSSYEKIQYDKDAIIFILNKRHQ